MCNRHWRSQRGARGGTCPTWLLKFSKIISVKQSLTDMEEKKKKKNGTSTWKWLWHRNKKGKKKFSNTKSCFCLFLRETCIYFIIFYFISLFTLFLLFMILFKVFYPWMMLEILQILLLISYKLAYHQLQKIISKIYSLYFLSNTNHIFTPSVYKVFSSCELVIFVYLF